MSKISEEVFAFIVEYKKQNDGLSPTLREICDHTRVRSTSHASLLVDKLEKDGFIERVAVAGQSRNIRVIGGEWSLPG